MYCSAIFISIAKIDDLRTFPDILPHEVHAEPSSSIPSFLAAEIGMTGIPSISSICVHQNRTSVFPSLHPSYSMLQDHWYIQFQSAAWSDINFFLYL